MICISHKAVSCSQLSRKNVSDVETETFRCFMENISSRWLWRTWRLVNDFGGCRFQDDGELKCDLSKLSLQMQTDHVPFSPQLPLKLSAAIKLQQLFSSVCVSHNGWLSRKTLPEGFHPAYRALKRREEDTRTELCLHELGLKTPGLPASYETALQPWKACRDPVHHFWTDVNGTSSLAPLSSWITAAAVGQWSIWIQNQSTSASLHLKGFGPQKTSNETALFLFWNRINVKHAFKA